MAAIELNSTPLISDANLTHYWRLEDNYTDTIGTLDTVVETGTPAYVTGLFGKGVDFDDGDYLTVSNSTAMSATTGFTWNAWFYRDSQSGVQENVVWYGGLYAYIYIYTNNKLRAVWKQGGNWKTPLESAAAPSATAWHMGTLTGDGTTITLYLDGSSVGSAVDSIDTQSVNFGISDGTGASLVGKVDDISVFNRALTSTEISNLYNGNWTSIKTILGLTKASVKTINGLAIASVKTINGLG